jgi:hypothetical protein
LGGREEEGDDRDEGAEEEQEVTDPKTSVLGVTPV